MKEYQEVTIKVIVFQYQDVITSSDEGVHIKDTWEERAFFN